MGKDINRKAKGTWWYGWVKFTYYDIFSQAEKVGAWSTDLEFATAGQAHRAAEQLAGALSAPSPRTRFGGKPSRSKTKKQESRLAVIEIGVSRVE